MRATRDGSEHGRGEEDDEGERGAKVGTPLEREGISASARTVSPAQDERELVDLVVQNLRDAREDAKDDGVSGGRGGTSETRSARAGSDFVRTLFSTVRARLSPTHPRCGCMDGETSHSSTVQTFFPIAAGRVAGSARARHARL